MAAQRTGLRGLHRAIALVLAACIAFAAAAAMAQSDDAVERVRNLVAAGEFQQAVDAADSALRSDPDNPRLLFWRDRAQRQLEGEPRGASVTGLERNPPPVRPRHSPQIPAAVLAPVPAETPEPAAPVEPTAPFVEPVDPAAPVIAPTLPAVAPPPPAVDPAAQPFADPGMVPVQPIPAPPPATTGGMGLGTILGGLLAVLILAGVVLFLMRRGKGTKAVETASIATAATGMAVAGSNMGPVVAAGAWPKKEMIDLEPDEASEQPEDEDDNLHDAITQQGGSAAAAGAAEDEARQSESFNSLLAGADDELLGSAVERSAATDPPPLPAQPPAPQAPPAPVEPEPDEDKTLKLDPPAAAPPPPPLPPAPDPDNAEIKLTDDDVALPDPGSGGLDLGGDDEDEQGDDVIRL